MPNLSIPAISTRIVVSVIIALSLVGCAGGMKTRHYSSVVEYLYPDARDTVAPEGVASLSVPVTVGVAFVPGGDSRRSGSSFRWGAGGTLTESERTKLMGEVADHFRQYEFIDRIEIIPSAYLTPRGSFTNLDQIRAMYGVDVIALVSYDQMQFTDEGFLSLTYWTIVGAYIVPGDKNDTHTMLDTAVYHIPSRRLLFRAPGTSHIAGRSTYVNLSEQLRKDSAEGFTTAATGMIGNLDLQLQQFREKLKTKPKEYAVQYRSGYSGGGGAFGLTGLAFLLVAAAGLRFRRHPRSGVRMTRDR